MRTILITGSSGLIDSEVATFFHQQGFIVYGVDNNQRDVFFDPQDDTHWSQQRLDRELKNFHHHELDMRNHQGILDLIKKLRHSGIIHTAAKPSHDLAVDVPFNDFDTNAVGALNLLEAASLRWRVTSWCKNTAAISVCPPAVFARNMNHYVTDCQFRFIYEI